MSPSAPNVLLVITDEWRAQSFGYTGDPNAQTPAIDAFAAESVNFEQAVSGTPVCCPARASFMTGQYPLTHGVYINDVELRPATPTLAEVFREAGYDTGYIGKWHLHGSPRGWFERRSAFVPANRHLGFQYWKASECTHDYNRSFYFEGDDTTKRYWPGYDAVAQTADATRFIRERRHAGRPYFLTVSYGPPHYPLESAPEAYREMYRDRDVTLRDNVPDEAKAEATADLRGYYAHIAAVDDCFASLLAAVGEDDDDTIVVFTSDHGDMMWSHGLEYKLTPWEESIRVPFLVRHRGVQTPRQCPALLNSPDVMPTILGFAGLEPPDGVEGVDLCRQAGPATAFLSVPVPFSTMRWTGFSEYRGVRNSRYTYVESAEGPWLLYDNQEDPFQMHNRCNDPELASEQLLLQAELGSWMERLGDESLPADAYIARDGLGHFYEVNEPLGTAESPWGDWSSTSRRARSWSVDTPLELLVADPAAGEVVARYWPGVTDGLLPPDLRSHSPRVISMLLSPTLCPSSLRIFDDALLRLPSPPSGVLQSVARGRGSTTLERLPADFTEAVG